MTTVTLNGTQLWTAPAGVLSVTAGVTSSSGGSSASNGTTNAGNAAGGGGYGAQTLTVTPGSTYQYTEGAAGTAGTSTGQAGGDAGTSTFGPDDLGQTITVTGGKGGPAAGANSVGGLGGTSTAPANFPGGQGGGRSGTSADGPGGGSSASAAGAGANGAAGGATPGAGGTAPAGGGNGSQGGSSAVSPASGGAPGGAPGGPGKATSGVKAGTAGTAGQLQLTYTVATASATGVAGAFGRITAVKKAIASFRGVLGAYPSAPRVVNQWAATSATPPVFGPSPPGIQSGYVPLTPAASVSGGTGVPTPGNWLFVIAGWNQAASLPPVTIGAGDDTHQWYRPQQPSSAAGSTRTTCWYQPNILSPTAVYVPPSGYVDGMAVTVLEVTGLGPWDVVTGVDLNYAAAATSLPLSLSAPSGASFFIAAVCGDLSTAGTTLAPAGWAPNATVTATNGTDHTGDTILASACIASGASQSVTATSSSQDMSGILIGVLQQAPSPVPGGINAAFPYMKYEAGFGSGYLTPADEITWTDLLQFANGARLRSWDESTGPQYELDALEASEVSTSLDNPDGALSPFNPGSPWYPDIVPGTPMRIRAIAPGGTRWRIISRNAETWPQTWDDLIRGETNSKLTDLWSIVNRPAPTPYRAEVLNDLPYAWWPMDDSGVNNATTLVNAAAGNTNPLQILTSPSGLSVSGTYGSVPSTATTYSALQQFEQNTGWMYGDPVSASWQQTGNGSSTHGRYLSCNDASFPPLSAGVTIEWWGNFTFANTGSGPANNGPGPIGQPSGALALWQVATGSAPLVLLSLDSSGHLQIDFGGSTTSIYSGADLRNNTWFGVIVTLTQTGWTATMNGGLATASGSGSLSSSAWQWLTVAAGTGSSGGGTSSAVTGIGNVSLAHTAVYPSVLPAGRIMSRFLAAYTAFGQLPAPSATASMISGDAATDGGGEYGPDGNVHSLALSPGGTVNALVTNTLNGYTSAPSTPEASAVFAAPQPGTTTAYGWLDVTGLAPQYAYYTASGAGGEKFAADSVSDFLYVPSFGSGASPPAVASALGDGAGQRIERYLQAGGVTVPARCIDPSPTAIVAGLDSGGQASGSNIANITASDSSFLFIDNMNMLCCWDRPHLDGQNPIWQLGDGPGQIPYYLAASAQANADPQRIFNDIAITQFDASQAAAAASAGDSTGSGEASGGLVYAPDASRYAAVKASQLQNGYQPLQNGTTSYLQSGPEIQAQANWYFDQFGQVQQRVENLEVHAENNPASWDFVLGANVGDLIQVSFDPPGQPTFSGTFRMTRIARKIMFTEDGVEGSITLTGDFEPSTYWA